MTTKTKINAKKMVESYDALIVEITHEHKIIIETLKRFRNEWMDKYSKEIEANNESNN